MAIGEAQSAGVRILMITGDHPRTAAHRPELGIGADGGASPGRRSTGSTRRP